MFRITREKLTRVHEAEQAQIWSALTRQRFGRSRLVATMS